MDLSSPNHECSYFIVHHFTRQVILFIIDSNKQILQLQFKYIILGCEIVAVKTFYVGTLLTWDRMYQSLISARVPIYLPMESYFWLNFRCSLHNIKNGDSLLSENRVVFLFPKCII